MTDVRLAEPLRRALLLRRRLEAAYPNGDGAEDHCGDSQDLSHPVLTGQAEIVAQAPEDDPNELYRDALEVEDPHDGADYPDQAKHPAHRNSQINETPVHDPLLSLLLSGLQEQPGQVER